MNKVYWFSGLSGAGKTKLSAELREELLARGEQVIALDGDVVRVGLCEDLSYTPQDRKENLRRVRELAVLLHAQGFNVLVACITPYEEDRQLNKDLLGETLVDIFVDTPFTTCMGEDAKGLYAKALAREIPNFTGISSRFETPKNSDFVIKRETENAAGLILGDAPAEVIEEKYIGPFAEQRKLADAAIASCPAYPVGKYEGRGIVICAGGLKYFTCAWVCINMLRALGCELPIEVWYLGDEEMDDNMKELVKPLGVTCVDALEVRKEHPVRYLKGWELKPYSIIHSSFKEVLFLDADNVAVVNPEYLFDSEQFKKTGAIFWPDFSNFKEERTVWELCNVAYRDEPEFESGQIFVDKERCWKELQLTMHMNEYSDTYYYHVHGDKDTFHMAWRRLDTDYSMPSQPIRKLVGTMCQHDFYGNRVFQHRNMLKWELDGENKRVTGFLHEDKCLKYLKSLSKKWDGVIGPPVPLDTEDPLILNLLETLAGSVHKYIVINKGFYNITLQRDGTILSGGDAEKCWWVKQLDVGLVLCIGKTQGEAECTLTQGVSGVWRGRTQDGKNHITLREVL